VGRAETNEVSIDHALISREHAVFTIGDRIELQDLGSRNGTFVRGERLAEKEKRVVTPGQLIEIGGATCIIQQGRAAATAARLITHDAFEHRLQELASRGADIALIRLHAGAIPPAEIQRVLDATLTANDLAAAYAPGEYEISIAEGARLDAVRERILKALARDGDVAIGAARAPRDGRTADELLERACEDVFRSPKALEAPVIIDGAMKDLYEVGRRVARGDISVLLLGETGVGKEVFAEAIHRASPRREGPFVRINCAALSETLLESELFGHEKGAFTGAAEAKIGLLESAGGGTIMLDELGEMPPQTQAKLLRVLEQRQVLPVGGLTPRPIDVRFIAATNRDIEAEVAKGHFRRDLYFRLNGVALVIPPLRERPSEIEALARRFADRAARDIGQTPPSLTPSAIELLLDHAWPGNIRELKNVMERAVLLADDTIDPEHLPHERMALPWSQPATPVESTDGDDDRERILKALEECAGNQTRAAKLLGIGRRTLTSKLTRYGIRRPRKS
jgi:DNA-binding NtrC family response regulator